MWCSARRWPPTQAAQAGHSLDDELHLLTVHGCLHLLGYDHAEPAEEREMFRLQNELLDTWRDHRAGLARTRPAGRGRRRRARHGRARPMPGNPHPAIDSSGRG